MVDYSETTYVDGHGVYHHVMWLLWQDGRYKEVNGQGRSEAEAKADAEMRWKNS